MKKIKSHPVIACLTCGGPLVVGAETCRYCHSRYDPDLTRLKHTHTALPAEPRLCPHCEVPLESLNVVAGDTFHIERCQQCVGLFFDAHELQLLIDKVSEEALETNLSRIKELMVDKPSGAKKVAYISCPVCHQQMGRKNFGSRSGVVMDLCAKDGVWLDPGELAVLVRWALLGGKAVDCPLQKEKQRVRAEINRLEQTRKQVRNRDSGLF